jgi:hypothetical protein
MYVSVFELILTNVIARMVKIEKMSDLIMIKFPGHLTAKTKEITKVAANNAMKFAFFPSKFCI